MMLWLFCAAFLSFTLTFNHLLSTLLAIEFMALSIYLLLVFNSLSLFNEMFYSLLYLSVVVCEGALGLSLIVLFVRKKGNEQLNSNMNM